MEDHFDPVRHRLVARVYKDGKAIGTPVHVSLQEIRSDLADLAANDPAPAPPPDPETPPELPYMPPTRIEQLLATGMLAMLAERSGASGGDYRWHGGDSDFVEAGQRMDVDQVLEYVAEKLREIAE